MGLPRWRDVSPDAKEVTSNKVDRTAPARSPIRRRNATRQPRIHRDRAPQVQALENFIAGRLRQAESSRRFRLDASHVDVSAAAPPPPPPVPESTHYAAQGSDSARENQLRQAQAFLQRPLATTTTAAYTPNFAPAAAAAARNPARDGLDDALNWSPLDADIPDVDHVDPEEGHVDHGRDVASMPPLRRMGRRRIAHPPLPSSSLRESWSPATSVDGLGDRERSVSPVADHWDTFLSTVAPDPLAPSADSSFTSAAASASFSNSNPSSRAGSSNSASSSRTHLTVPSQRQSPPDEPMRVCDTDDSSSGSDFDEEEFDTVSFVPDEDRSGSTYRQVADEAATLERSQQRLRQLQREIRFGYRRLRRNNQQRESVEQQRRERERSARRLRPHHRAVTQRQLDERTGEVSRHLDGAEQTLSDESHEFIRRRVADYVPDMRVVNEAEGNEADARSNEQGVTPWAEVQTNLRDLRANIQESVGHSALAASQRV
ncbi:uncharacterized protein EI97DRAFT_500281 [Westerdykella ornata]|uniref:Uncharacterized protein n=1 Tax=Westerdykella ornata TaxID=318751 RepID=A0A6A6JP89_WESOR|nr:uncharacterized protein EI97DRAFT_500281 [Westerdykella ornata]KAF2278084.1 hypothetical protein EI97DRAFT_500281 [Westerdykella ornata]